MRHFFLLIASLITISGIAQQRNAPYVPSDPGETFNVVIHLPTADLHFDITNILLEIDRHDWSVLGKTPAEISTLKTWLAKHKTTGLVVTPAMLKDKTHADYNPVKLLSEYVSGMMLQRFQQGHVYRPASKSPAAQPIEWSQVILTESPYVARFDFYFKGEKKPFLVTQPIDTQLEDEWEDIGAIAVGELAPEVSERLQRIMFFDYKTVPGHPMTGLTNQGDTVEFSLNEPPRFKGGSMKLEEFISTRLTFPESAARAGIYGTFIEVAATFMKDGTVRDLVIAEGDPRFYGEAIRLLQESSGLWEPGVLRGKKCNVRFTTKLLLSRPSW